MTAYIIARGEAEDPAKLKDYMSTTPPIIEKYRGRFIARGGPAESRRIVVIEFPSLDDAEAFHHSPEYTQTRRLRDGIAIAEFIAVEGIG